MKYALVSLGCQMNSSDSERVSFLLESMGYAHTEHEEEAHILGLVACSVRQRAIDKAFSRINKWNNWKDGRNLLTFATGCVLPSDWERFAELFDFVFPITELPDFPDRIRQYGVVTPVDLVPSAREKGDLDYLKIQPSYSSSFQAFVPIQNGCDKFCSFCAVPFTRGREVSRPSEEILTEIKKLINEGYKSITLLGQNVNSYGLDKAGKERSFASLLKEIGEIGRGSADNPWIYFTSPHPRDMKRNVLETIAEYDCLAKQIHLPLQSGDDQLLIKMNRNHSVNEYRKIVEEIREILPIATLFTDIIVGFPGETDEQFENTRRAIDRFQYNMAYIAMYSPRPGTRSDRWRDDISHDEKRRRLHVLSEDLRHNSRQENDLLIGKRVPVLVTGTDRKPNYLSGHTEGKIVTRFLSSDKSLIGNVLDVKITDAADLSVEGKI